MPIIYSSWLCLFLWFYSPVFCAASGDSHKLSIDELIDTQLSAHQRTIHTLREGLLALKESPTASGGAGSVASRSGKSVIERWDNRNFALATLILIRKDGNREIFPVQGPGLKIGGSEGATIYDSGYDRTTNVLPSPSACFEQWERYLGKGADIVTSPGTVKVRKQLEGEEGGALSLIEAGVQKVSESLASGDIIDLDDFIAINEQIRTYQGFIHTWVSSGWHSEQRIIAELDSEPLKRALRDIHTATPIARIICCLHTHLSPCCEREKSYCMKSLQNWPKRWTFKEEFADIETIMAVGFSQEHASITHMESSGSDFKLRKEPEIAVAKDLHFAKGYLKLANLKRQIGAFRHTRPYLISFYEHKLFEVLIDPLSTLAKTKLAKKYLRIPATYYADIGRNPLDVSNFYIEFPGGGKLKKSVTGEGIRGINFHSDGPFAATSITELSAGAIKVDLEPDSTDWDIWLRVMFLCISQGEE